MSGQTLLVPSFGPVLSGSASSLLTNLISYWTLDEASGTRVDSVVASGNDLTDNNTVTQNTGKISNAAEYVAANSEYLSRADNSSLSIGDIDFTFAFWIYVTDLAGVTLGVMGKDGGGGADEFRVLLGGVDHPSIANKLYLQICPGGTAAAVVSSVQLSVNTWYFAVMWHDATADTVNIQINNGTADSAATGAAVPTDSAKAFQLGRASALYYTSMRLDEVGFWKAVLTSAQRTSLYNSGNGITYPFTGVP